MRPERLRRARPPRVGWPVTKASETKLLRAAEVIAKCITKAVCVEGNVLWICQLDGETHQLTNVTIGVL